MEKILSYGKRTIEGERYKKLYTMLLDAIPSSVLTIGRDFKIVSTNRNFLVKSRRTRDETIGHRLEDVFPAVILQHMNIVAQIRHVFQSGLPTSGNRMSYRTPGMPMRIYYYRIFPFSWPDAVENVMLLMDDVTEQVRLGEEVRRVERHLASIFESASDIILSVDVHGKILSWNPAAEKKSGYSFMEVKGNFLADYVIFDRRSEMEEIFSSMSKDQNSRMEEWDLLTKNGSTVRVFWVFSTMKDDNCETVAIVGVGRDLTERKELEAHLLKSQKFAALGVMASGIAHEIRNPLAICFSAAQFLQESDTSEGFRKDCVEKIIAGIQRASNIIENLLRYARPSGKSQMHPVEMKTLVEQSVALVSNQAKIHKIEIQIAASTMPFWVNGNASLLEQVVVNLLLNAIQAMPDGGTIRFVLRKSDEEVLLRLADSGRGISKQDLDKIFDPFYTTSSAGRGTGLGLAISYSIVKQHQGRISVESEHGKGSTFTVTLPAI